MFKSSSLLVRLCVSCLFGLFAIAVQAQSSQAFVAANGLNSGTCNLANPCRDVNYALTQIASGGQVLIITSGNYAAFTVDKAAKIAAAPGVMAVISHAGFNEAVILVTGSLTTDKVILSGLHIDGQGITQDGIRAGSVKLVVENCHIEARINGIFINNSASVYLINTTFRNSTEGVSMSFRANASAVTGDLIIEGCRFFNHSFAAVDVLAENANAMRVTLRNSVLQNSNGSGLRVSGTAGASADVQIEECLFTDLGLGILVTGVGATARVSDSTITANNIGLQGNSILSRGNNTLEGNTSNGNFSANYSAK